jgi:thiamine-monophosphate kinase
MTAPERLHTEEAIIQGFLVPLAAGAPGAHGLKDDCATIAPSAGCELVLKTDAIAEGVHFLPTDSPRDIGWKALAVNVSDLAAKGARPLGYLMSLAFPEAPTAAWMAGFAGGLEEAQAAFGMHLLGGDTDRRPGPISITPMVIGEVPIGRMVLRTAARPGDVVCVSGTLGDSGLGLALQRDAGLAAQWRLDGRHADHLRQCFLRPAPRLGLAAALLGHAQASMDLSDGLMKDLGRMCRASGVGAIVELDAMPMSPAFACVAAVDPEAAARSRFAGDDYEVLCAVPPDRFAAFAAAAAAAGIAVTRIGAFTADRDVRLLDAAGAAVDVGTTGWDHF